MNENCFNLNELNEIKKELVNRAKNILSVDSLPQNFEILVKEEDDENNNKLYKLQCCYEINNSLHEFLYKELSEHLFDLIAPDTVKDVSSI